MKQLTCPSPSPSYITSTLLILGFLAIASIYWSFPKGETQRFVQLLLDFVSSLGIYGPAILLVINCIGVLLCFPLNVVFELASGFLFGTFRGSLMVSTAKCVGALLSFYLGKTLLKDYISSRINKSDKLLEIYNEMSLESFRLAIMLRLSPLPSWLSNYGLAITPITVHQFMFATIIAGFPGILRNVYLGSIMNSTMNISNENNTLALWSQYALGILSIIGSVFFTKYMYKYYNIVRK